MADKLDSTELAKPTVGEAEKEVVNVHDDKQGIHKEEASAGGGKVSTNQRFNTGPKPVAQAKPFKLNG